VCVQEHAHEQAAEQRTPRVDAVVEPPNARLRGGVDERERALEELLPCAGRQRAWERERAGRRTASGRLDSSSSTSQSCMPSGSEEAAGVDMVEGGQGAR
jgi:hypothetical protein